jgi:hypothetical protein
MARTRVYRNVKTGEFVSEETYNRVVSHGGESVKGEYVEMPDETTVTSVDDLFDIYDNTGDDDFVEYEFHGTGDTGRSKGR